MGNHQFKMDQIPQRGQIVTIKQSNYTISQKFDKDAIFVGAKAKVVGTKDLMQSRPNAPKITASLIQIQNGLVEVYLTNNLEY